MHKEWAFTIKEIKEVDEIVIEPTKEEVKEEREAIILTPEAGVYLVLKRVLHTRETVKEESQHELIFHSRCAISGEECSLIIYGGSCTNVASSHIVDKLKLPIVCHR